MNSDDDRGSGPFADWITLILLGLVILAIAWVTLYPRVFKSRMQADDTRVQLMFISAAATEYYRAHNTWPVSIQEIARTDPKGNIAALKGITNDVWGHPFVFEAFDPQRGYGRVVSYGADRLPGGRGKARDLFFPFAEDQGKSVEVLHRLQAKR